MNMANTTTARMLPLASAAKEFWNRLAKKCRKNSGSVSWRASKSFIASANRSSDSPAPGLNRFAAISATSIATLVVRVK
jgi:hypothetical protein